MKLQALVIGAALATAAMVSPAFAWTQLGARDVMDRTDRDTIHLNGHHRFERIKLCVYRNPVHFYDLDVRFNNGGHQDVSVRQRINPGQCTRAINLTGDDRDIAYVTMLYEETSWRRGAHATVRLFGE